MAALATAGLRGLIAGPGPPPDPCSPPPHCSPETHKPHAHAPVCRRGRGRGPAPFPAQTLSRPLPSPRTERRTRAHRKHPVLSDRRGPRPDAGRTAGRGSPRCLRPPAPCPALETGVLPPDRPHPDPFIKRRGDSTFRWTRPAAGAPWPGAAVQSRVRGRGGRRPRESCARIKGAAGSGDRCGRVSASRAPCSRLPPRRACAAAGRAPAGCTAWAARSTSRLRGRSQGGA